MDLTELLECALDSAKQRGRIRNALVRAHIETLDQLLARTRQELLGMKNVGPRIVGDIEKSLEEMGLRLGMRSGRRVCPRCQHVIED
jgi:DNA-directed RNA polymerase alpha subunit